MRNKITLFIFILLTIAFKGFAHPYYVSVMEVHLHTSSQTFDVSCSMFTDDLETAIKKTQLTNTDLQKEITASQVLEIIYRYVQARFEISIDGTIAPYLLVGCENIEASTWCYLEGKFGSSATSVKITNSLLFDFLPEQTNMVHVYVDEVRKSYKLNNPEKTVVFAF